MLLDRNCVPGIKSVGHNRVVSVAACIRAIRPCNKGVVQEGQEPVDIVNSAHRSEAGSDHAASEC